MPPKITFTKEDVVQAAFDLVEKKGLKYLSARHVAKKLNSSTAPVYSYFSSMEELKREVLRKAKDLLFEYATTPHTEWLFLNMGVGYALFGRDHKELFKAIFFHKSKNRDILNELLIELEKEMKKNSDFAKMSEENRRNLLRKMWMFTHGMTSLLCVGLLEEESEEYITKTLEEVGHVIIAEALEENQT